MPARERQAYRGSARAAAGISVASRVASWPARVGNTPLRRITPGQSRPVLPVWVSCRQAWAPASAIASSRISCDVLFPPLGPSGKLCSSWFRIPRCDGAQARNGVAVSSPRRPSFCSPSIRIGLEKQDRVNTIGPGRVCSSSCSGVSDVAKLEVGLEVRLEAGRVCFGQSSMHLHDSSPNRVPHEISALRDKVGHPVPSHP